jgi:hypothetical protein
VQQAACGVLHSHAQDAGYTGPSMLRVPNIAMNVCVQSVLFVLTTMMRRQQKVAMAMAHDGWLVIKKMYELRTLL